MVVFFDDGDFLDDRVCTTESLYVNVVLIDIFVPLDFEVAVTL